MKSDILKLSTLRVWLWQLNRADWLCFFPNKKSRKKGRYLLDCDLIGQIEYHPEVIVEAIEIVWPIYMKHRVLIEGLDY